ncbi:MAG: hypothetical protein GF346_02540, partial [Candidatus Eisenbacteria bacterium]|nr:hypothetical protein [Candidatus Latescibacterota bacterium]MBD3301298.1 hypothetical protein [Candidatus Eisenbacteria bacterium]
MSGRGSRALVFLSVLALVTCGVAYYSAQADVLNVAPANNIVINYPSFPNAGGPYLIGATYEPENELVWLVFNEGVTDASTALGDFTSDTFDLASAVLGDDDGDHVLTLDVSGVGDFTDDGTERIRIKDLAVLESADDGSFSDDVSWVEIGRGPIPIDITVTGFEDDGDLTTQRVTITWNAAASVVSDADAAFGETPEFNGADLDLGDDDTDTWTIDQDAGSAIDFLDLKPGISKLHIELGSVRYAAGSPNNIQTDRDLRLVMGNEGPILVAAYYNNFGNGDVEDDVLWAVFDQPVDPASFGGTAFGAGANFDENGTWTSGAGLPGLAFPGFTTNVVEISGMNPLDPPISGDDLTHLGANPIEDFQGAAFGTTDVTVDVHVGPGIIRASYDDGQTVGTLESEVANDEFIVWLSEPIANPADVDTTDFTFPTPINGGSGWYYGENVEIQVDANVGGLGKVTFTNFSGIVDPNLRLRPGVQVTAVDDGSPIAGDVTGADISTIHALPLTDESRPADVLLTALSQRDSWDASGPTDLDSLFFAWSESNADDSDQYVVYITKTLPNDIDNDWMNANLARAMPIGNLSQTIIDGEHMVGILVQPDETQPAVDGAITRTTDDVDLVLDDQVYILVAATDWTGNVQYREQQGNDALLFGVPFWVGPICSLQDFYFGAGDNANWDSDIVHVVGDSLDTGLEYFVFGDPLAVPCPSDSV